MLSSQVLDRLGALNRQPLPETDVDASTIVARRVKTTRRTKSIAQDAFHLDRGEAFETAWGPCWRIDKSLTELWPQSSDRLLSLEAQFQDALNPAIGPELISLHTAYPRRVLYLDLETCGLAGAMAFLVGLIHHDGLAWRLTQFLARDYGEEKAMLQALWSLARDKAVLVTFNGKSFDWPLVHDRSTRHHLGQRANTSRSGETVSRELASLEPGEHDALTRRDVRPELAHCDVLHHARRRWRSSLPNCRLQTLEQYLCQRRRVADIAGRDIPAAYHEYVRTKDAHQMRTILHHNALDLVTLLEVSLRVAIR